MPCLAAGTLPSLIASARALGCVLGALALDLPRRGFVPPIPPPAGPPGPLQFVDVIGLSLGVSLAMLIAGYILEGVPSSPTKPAVHPLEA